MMPQQWFQETNGRSKRQKKRQTNPKNDNGRIELSAGISSTTTVSNDAYMQINLQDLEAYTSRIEASERQRRRRIWARLFGVLFAGLVIMAGVHSWSHKKEPTGNIHAEEPETKPPSVSHTAQIQSDNSKNGTFAHLEEENYQAYPLTACEVDLLGENTSFHKLVHLLGTNAAPAQFHCRQDAPDCDWINPTQAEPRRSNDAQEIKGWETAVAAHMALLQARLHKEVAQDVDVALIGGSLVEHLEGKQLGKAKPKWKRDEDVFETLFTKQGGGSIEGVALGLDGDRASHLLYRLQKGTLTVFPNFQPKVWWIIVGTQDWQLGVAPHSIVVAIITIVQSIRQIHPQAAIVLNSLLPHPSIAVQSSLQQVNKFLGCYVHAQTLIDEDKWHKKRRPNQPRAHHRKLHFFNATHLFLQPHANQSHQVNPEYILQEHGNYPGPQGNWVWGHKIVETVQQIVMEGN